MNKFPLPDGIKPKSASITIGHEEYDLIFKSTLIPQHREDPTILRWILEYVRLRDINDSAKAVGIHPLTARALRNRRDIFKCIEAITQVLVHKHGIDPGELVAKVKEVVDFDPIELENPDGSFKKHMKDVPGQTRRAIKKLKVKNFFEVDQNGIRVWAGEIIEYEFHDKLRAAELVAREVDLFKEKKVMQHDMTQNMAQMLLDSKQRAEAIDVTPLQIEGGDDDSTSGE